MLVFADRHFQSFDDRDSGSVFCDIEFRRCEFEHCLVSMTFDPSLRSTVRNVRLIGCSQFDCHLQCAIVEDVVVDGLATNGQVWQTFGAVFNRVVLRGKIDDVFISNDIQGDFFMREKYRQQQVADFRVVNAEYYRHVEWALDISRAEAKDLCIHGVPTDLIRRDPETQAVISRAKAAEGDWRALDFKEKLVQVAIELFLHRDEPSTVLIVPKRDPKFRRCLDDLNLLRKAGIVEPD